MKQILVVDDNTEIREFMCNILKLAGYQVCEAGDGGSAIELFRGHPVDLLVTDLVMPDVEGIETIRDVKKRYPHTKIIATSGFNLYLEMAGRLGADKTFEKPFDIRDFLSTVRTLLQPGRSVSPFLGAPVRHSEDTSVFLTPDAWRKTA